MRHVRVFGILGLASLAAAAVAFAQTTVIPVPDSAPVQSEPLDANAVAALAKTHWGDPKAGATKAGACAACHGVDGNPSDPQYPRLAGMPERYVAQQLALFKSGQRNSGMAAVMMPMASPLSAQDMRDVGAWFAQQKAGAGVADDSPIAAGPHAGEKFYTVGEALYRGGDAKRDIPACMACHGPTGAGNPGPAYPHLAGQQSDYVARRLQEYRTGTTSYGDPSHFDIMAAVAKNLSDDEIQSLASYLQGLHPRADDLAAAAAPAPAPAAPAAPATAPASGDAPQQPAPTQPQEPVAGQS